MFKVLRFPNDDVVARPSDVITAILAASGREDQRLP
jgi:very-short-patch-repair endonuclease